MVIPFCVRLQSRWVWPWHSDRDRHGKQIRILTGISVNPVFPKMCPSESGWIWVGIGCYCQKMGNRACFLEIPAEPKQWKVLECPSAVANLPCLQNYFCMIQGEFGDFPYLPGWSRWGSGWEEKSIAFGGCWMLCSSQPSSCSSICVDRAPGQAHAASGRRGKDTADQGRNQSWKQVSVAGANACAFQEPKSRLCWSLVRSRG